MSNYQPTYLGEVELNEDTLAHFGVKGMKWGRRKKSSKAKRGKAAVLSRHVKELAYSVKNRRKLEKAFDTYAEQISKARTNEERAALETAIQNTYARMNPDIHSVDFRETNKGGNLSYNTLNRRLSGEGAREEDKNKTQYYIEGSKNYYRTEKDRRKKK